jgi:hypothetical protein
MFGSGVRVGRAGGLAIASLALAGYAHNLPERRRLPRRR